MKRTYLRLLKHFFFRQPNTPLQLIHFITSRCNAKCGHCFYWSQLNTKGELSLEEIEKVTKTLKDLVILNFSGGEPFLRQDFAEVVKSYYRNTPVKEVTVPSNGTFTEKMQKDCTEILEHCPELDLNIVISLDGLEKIHDEIRQVKDCYKTAKKSFLMLKELQKKYPALQVSVVSTLTALNQDTLEEFHREVNEEWQPDVFSLNLIRGEAKKMDLFGVHMKNYKKFFELQSRSKKKGVKAFLRDFMNKLRTDMILKTVEKKEFILPCTAGRLLGVMYEKGDVYPCELLNGKRLGNVRDYDYNFAALWSSAETKKTADWVVQSKCYCTHECFLRFNVLYKPSYVIKNSVKNIFEKQTTPSLTEKEKSEGDQGKELVQIGLIRGIRAK